jgi:hypothetical protein
LDSSFHGAAERNPTFKLDRHVLGDQLGIKLRSAHFDDIDLHL